MKFGDDPLTNYLILSQLMLECHLVISLEIYYALVRSSRPEVFCKKCVFRNFAKFAGNICARVSFLIKLQAETCSFIIKAALAQVLSCEFCEISKKTYFYGAPAVAASDWSDKPLLNIKKYRGLS